MIFYQGSKEQEKDTGPQGLPLDPKLSKEKAKWLEKQRNREYNDFLMKVYGKSFNGYSIIYIWIDNLMTIFVFVLFILLDSQMLYCIGIKYLRYREQHDTRNYIYKLN